MDVTDQVRKEIIQKATQYIRDEKDEFFNKEVADALDEGAFEQLYERFYSELAFGTAGMRGILGGGTNRINSFMVRKVTQGFANYLHKHTKHPSVAIAYDTRNYSSEFALQTALTLCANNIRVMLFDTVRPVPVLSFSVRHLKSTAGVVITASHNPSAYNGYKVYWSDGGQVTPPHDVGIAKEVERITSDMILHIDEQEAIEKGLLTYMPPEVEQSYYDSVIESLTHEEVLRNSSIHVAYTPLHGSGLEPITHLYDRLGISYDIVEEQRQYDGNFPTIKCLFIRSFKKKNETH
jgi:phosphoglucomutase